MQHHFFSILTGIVVTLFISSCTSNQCLPNQYSETDLSSLAKPETRNIKVKPKKRDLQRTSITQKTKNIILVSNLVADDEDIGHNKITKIVSKCQYKGQCAKLIRDKIIDRWQYQRSYPKFKTILVLELSKQGYISVIRLKHSSGRRAFDDSVIKAVRHAAPFTEITYLPEVDLAEFSSIEMVFKR